MVAGLICILLIIALISLIKLCRSTRKIQKFQIQKLKHENCHEKDECEQCFGKPVNKK